MVLFGAEPLFIERLTSKQPFCAGVLIMHKGRILVTLNDDGLPADKSSNFYRIGGVGGGQEPSETILQCALREAQEEISGAVELIPSPVSYLHDMDIGAIECASIADACPPFLLQRVTNRTPDTPYKPGLPIGPYIYFAIYLACVKNWDTVAPGDDVCGLISVLPDEWAILDQQPTIRQLEAMGVRVWRNSGLRPDFRVWLPENESFRTVVELLLR